MANSEDTWMIILWIYFQKICQLSNYKEAVSFIIINGRTPYYWPIFVHYLQKYLDHLKGSQQSLLQTILFYPASIVPHQFNFWKDIQLSIYIYGYKWSPLTTSSTTNHQIPCQTYHLCEHQKWIWPCGLCIILHD